MDGDARAGFNLNTAVVVISALGLLAAGAGAFTSITNEQAKIAEKIAGNQESWERQFQQEAGRLATLEQWRVTIDSDLAIRREKNAATLASIQKDISEIQRSIDLISNVLTHPTRRGDIGGPGNFAGEVP